MTKKTKKDIVLELSKQLDLPQLTTRKIVQGTFDTLIDVIAEHGRIELRNFGVFVVRVRKPRKARNPKTGAEIDVPARLVVQFKPGRMMEERVEQNKERLMEALKSAPWDTTAGMEED